MSLRGKDFASFCAYAKEHGWADPEEHSGYLDTWDAPRTAKLDGDFSAKELRVIADFLDSDFAKAASSSVTRRE